MANRIVSRAKRSPQALMSLIVNGYSYDDVDAIIVTFGVITALCVSFALPLQYTATAEEMQRGTFHGLICGSALFRQFAITTMGTESFQFVRPGFGTDGGEFNVSATIETVGDRFGENLWYRDDGYAATRTCRQEADDVGIAVQLLVEKFPMHVMDAWILHHGAHTFAEHVEVLASFAAALLMTSVLMSVILYIGLAMSAAREDESGRALRVYMAVCGPLMLGNIVIFIVGIILFYVSHSRYLIAVSPFEAKASGRAISSLMFILIPVVSFTLALTLAVVACSYRYLEKKAAGEAAPQEMATAGV